MSVRPVKHALFKSLYGGAFPGAIGDRFPALKNLHHPALYPIEEVSARGLDRVAADVPEATVFVQPRSASYVLMEDHLLDRVLAALKRGFAEWRMPVFVGTTDDYAFGAATADSVPGTGLLGHRLAANPVEQAFSEHWRTGFDGTDGTDWFDWFRWTLDAQRGDPALPATPRERALVHTCDPVARDARGARLLGPGANR